MGSKTAARQAAIRAGVPVVPGTQDPLGPDVPEERVADIAGEIGYPVMVKAVAGGGGKGLRVVWSRAELSGAIRAARSEAAASFGRQLVPFFLGLGDLIGLVGGHGVHRYRRCGLRRQRREQQRRYRYQGPKETHGVT